MSKPTKKKKKKEKRKKEKKEKIMTELLVMTSAKNQERIK